MVSFVICFHSSRTDNLRQMLRFLISREKCEKEVLLICNDLTHEKFPGCRLVNMGLKEYRKNVMCNDGVDRAKGKVIALLDSDRIMPHGYFSDAADSLKPGEFMACEKMIKLVRPHADEEIESGKIEWRDDFRSKGWELWSKNLFSGNTVFHKEDFISSGGMDESFLGYGFADNDMTRNVMTKGFAIRWAKKVEIHLHHEEEIMQSGSIVGLDRYMNGSRKNLCRFLRKWGDMKEYGDHCGCLL